MKVYIGPYKNWFGPHQFVDAVFPFLSEERRDKLKDRIPAKPFYVIDKLKGSDHKIKVRIDGYDVWSMDNTLAHIIHPMLVKLKENKHGSPYVEDEDVPEHLRSYQAKTPKENEYDTDEFHHDRWEWVLDEMIWAFSQKLVDWEEQYYSGKPKFEFIELKDNPDLVEMVDHKESTFKVDTEGYNKHQARISNGLRLFGKYYEALWT